MHTDVRVKTTFLKKLKKKKIPITFLRRGPSSRCSGKGAHVPPPLLSSKLQRAAVVESGAFYCLPWYQYSIWESSWGWQPFPLFFLIFSFFLIPFLSKKEHHKNTCMPLLINLFSKLTRLSSRITFYFFHFLLKQEHFQLKQCKYIW